MKNKINNTDDAAEFDLHDQDHTDVEFDMVEGDDELDEESTEMLFILEKIYEFITTMLEKNVHPHLIQSALLANWLQIVVMNCDETEEFFLAQIEKMEEFIPLVVAKLTEISKMLPDEIAESMSAEARAHFKEMQNQIIELAKQEMAPEDFAAQEKIVEDKTEELFEMFEQSNAHPLDVEAAFLFYWIHFLSMDHGFTDAKIEKLIYYWGDVFEPMAVFVRTHMGIEDAF
ncbi:MAG: hypothetical protein Q8S21_05710 [Candidatus Paracaedibacteraceae bacterium]|nr:hypothetical protein [Candidatus Paracaedibacteraceae bacterium]